MGKARNRRLCGHSGFIDAFGDGLDLETAGSQRVRPKETGRTGYDPADLPKLYI